MKILRTLLLFVTVFGAAALTAVAADPSGTWKFTAGGPNGRSMESTLTLNLTGGQLSGWIENRAGKTAIENARFADDQLSFSVQREFGRRLRKTKLTVRYSGKLEGDTIAGTIETTGRKKQPISIPWEAKRQK